MIKKEELTNPDSCLNRAGDDELVFVLLARDPAAPAAVRAWARERERLGKNHPLDAQIREAEQCADVMEKESQRIARAARGKYPIDRPCSACSAGDYAMRYHDHDPPFRKGCGPEAALGTDAYQARERGRVLTAPAECPNPLCGSTDRRWGKIVAWAGLTPVYCSNPWHRNTL